MKTLVAFARNHCADWYHQEKYCTRFETDCLLSLGRPCQHFKEAVFPICDPNYKFATETDKYQAVLKELKKLDYNVLETDRDIRRCGCGTPLKLRERVCRKCRKRRSRESAKKYRSNRHS